jgi:hypothetical protein
MFLIMLSDYGLREEKYVKSICEYIDNNVGRKVLSIVFMNLYPESGKRDKRSLAKYTTEIINKLSSKNVLEEIKNTPTFKLPERNTPHGTYLIKEHPRLVDEPGFGKGKEGEMIIERDPYNFDFTRAR